jgi:polyphosphate kinase 2 (PPK2 family)
MGFCTDGEYERFMRLVPSFEQEIVEEAVAQEASMLGPLYWRYP